MDGHGCHTPGVVVPVPAPEPGHVETVENPGVQLEVGQGRRLLFDLSCMNLQGQLLDLCERSVHQGSLQALPFAVFDVHLQIIDRSLKEYEKYLI